VKSWQGYVEMNKGRKLKFCWGSDIRVAELEHTPSRDEVDAILQKEFKSDNLELRYHPSSVWRIVLRVRSGRHLPKTEREGLTNSFCRARIVPDSLLFEGYSRVPHKSQTKVAKNSLSPEWNETLTWNLRGDMDLATISALHLLVELRTKGKDQKEEQLGLIDLPVQDYLVRRVRARLWDGQAAELEEQLKLLQGDSGASLPPALQQAKVERMQQNIEYLKDLKRKSLSSSDAWHRARWQPGCRAVCRGLDPSSPDEIFVQGADGQLTSLHLAIDFELSDYHQNCFLNAMSDFVSNLLESSRGLLMKKADKYIKAFSEQGLGMEDFLSKDFECIADDAKLARWRVTEASARRVILQAVREAGSRWLNFCELSVDCSHPNIPMKPSDEVSIRREEQLQRACEEAELLSEKGTIKLFVCAPLKITIMECAQLPKMDKLGSCDPYVKVVAGEKEYLTSVRYNTMSPSWGAGQVFYHSSREWNERMRIEVWDFDELRLLNMEKRKTSVIRSDEFIGYAELPEMHDIVNDGFSLDDYFLLVDERGEYVVGYQADTFADQFSRIRLQIRANSSKSDHATSLDDVSLVQSPTKSPTSPNSSLDFNKSFKSQLGGERDELQALLFQQFTTFSMYGKEEGTQTGEGEVKAGKKTEEEQESFANKARQREGRTSQYEIMQGNRIYSMNFIEFLSFARARSISPSYLDKEQLAEFFFAAKGTIRRRMLEGDREIDLEQFKTLCSLIADFFRITVKDILLGRIEEAVRQVEEEDEEDEEEDEEAIAFERLRNYPLHAAASTGDVSKFAEELLKWRELQQREADQRKGIGRDLPYLVRMMMRRKRAKEFKISIFKKDKQVATSYLLNEQILHRGDAGGWTALHHAVSRRKIDVVQFILLEGCDVNIPNKFFLRTPLHLAVQRRDREMIRVLLQFGADWSRCDKDGKSCLSYADTTLIEAVYDLSLKMDDDKKLIDDQQLQLGAVPSLQEEIRLLPQEPILAARPPRCFSLLLGGPRQENLKFPWHSGATASLDSLFELTTREFDSSQGSQADVNKKDASTNFGQDLPSVVEDHKNFKELARRFRINVKENANTNMTRKQTLQQVRSLFEEPNADMFFIVYSGHAQKKSGRWVAVDGYIDLYDILTLFHQARTKQGKQHSDSLGPRLIIISDSSSSGVWAEQHRSLRSSLPPSSSRLLFPYSTMGGKEDRRRAQLKTEKPTMEGGQARDEDLIAVSKFVAVMSSCSPGERALECARGGDFLSTWTSLPIQGRLRLQGAVLSSSSIRLFGSNCRQHPLLSVGWVLTPSSLNPRVLSVLPGLYLTGSCFYEG